jgi:hypothetical protein
MDYYTFNIFIDWILLYNNLNYEYNIDFIDNLKIVNKTFYNSLQENIMYKRVLSVNLLNLNFLIKGYDSNLVYDLLQPTNGIINTKKKDLDNIRDYNWLLKNIFPDNNNGFSSLNKGIFNYRNDRLDPFRNIRLCPARRLKNQIKNSIMLSLAMHHAEYNYSMNKFREIDDYL